MCVAAGVRRRGGNVSREDDRGTSDIHRGVDDSCICKAIQHRPTGSQRSRGKLTTITVDPLHSNPAGVRIDTELATTRGIRVTTEMKR